MFFEGSERKEDFLDQKNIGSKNHQNFYFFQNVSPWFLSKNGQLCKMDQEKVFFELSERKKAFLDHNNIG